jgi:O-antigen ligase
VLLLTGLFIFINTSISERFGYLSNTIGALSSGDNVQSGEQDFDRTMLLAFAFELIQNNPLFGVGIGLANYQRGLEDIGVNFHRLSKSHNFYVSYLAELGVFGLSILFFAFFRIYRVLKINAFGAQCFKTAAILLIFNEYILLPELWYFFGLLLAIVSSAENKIKEIKYER